VVTTSNGWQRSLSRPEEKPLGAKNEVAVRGQLNFDLGPDSTLLLRAYWNRDQSDGLALTPVDGRTLGLATAQKSATRGRPVIFSDGDNRAADWSPEFRPSRDNTSKGVAGTLNLALGAVKLTAISAYDDFRRDEYNDLDGSPADDSNAHNLSRIKAFSQEVRLSNQSEDTPLQWIVGGYYSHDRVDEDYRFYMPDSSFGYGLGIKALNTRYRQKTSSLAGFSHVEARVVDGVRLIAGARYTRETRRFAGCTYDLDGSLTSFVNRILIPVVIRSTGLPIPPNMQPGGCSVYDDRPDSPTYGTFADAEERARTSKWMWKGGVEVDASRDVLLYANISSGFKSGGFNGANANLKSQQSNYRPEQLTAYEAGVKANLRSARLYLDSSVFYYDYKDKQTNGTAVTFVGNITGITNIPKSRIFGVDASARWAPFTGASLQLSGTYIDSKIQRWQAVSPSSAYPRIVSYDAAGLPLPNTPKWSLVASPSYAFAVGGDRQIKLAADYYYRSGTKGIGAVFQDIPGYGLVDAEISCGPADGRWSVAIWGKNVFDKYYYNYAGLPGNSNYVRAVGAPATYGVRFGASL
jgi:iron complex outermembrane receptor protein